MRGIINHLSKTSLISSRVVGNVHLNLLVLGRSMMTKTFIEDKNYKGLYYHPTIDSTNYLVSFLSNNDKVNKHADIAVIGRIPFDSEVDDNNNPKITIQNFIENKKFTQFLHQVIAENVGDSDAQLQALAKYYQNGWLHVADARDPAVWGRIPYPEDIFGMVQVKDGQIIQGTYQPMPTHLSHFSNY
ncbi:hypothetical protein RclHR1_14860004 [Rhizophagus clarus]|uniref:Uncharacterized protein n=1 Tax=Rhizophagus clarus TaxID=94130 RepID=A0A2Z6QI19_9GLOM|nr:hypothetical protein RclHR1_14860004 [Rhizophagus clarus]